MSPIEANQGSSASDATTLASYEMDEEDVSDPSSSCPTAPFPCGIASCSISGKVSSGALSDCCKPGAGGAVLLESSGSCSPGAGSLRGG